MEKISIEEVIYEDEPYSEPCDECSGTRYPIEKHDEHCSLYHEDHLEEEYNGTR